MGCEREGGRGEDERGVGDEGEREGYEVRERGRGGRESSIR